MIPLFIYKKEAPWGFTFLVRGPDQAAWAVDDPVYQGYELVASIEARTWIQCFLNYKWSDRRKIQALRDRMVLELEGREE